VREAVVGRSSLVVGLAAIRYELIDLESSILKCFF
jgi:hypothetical protein